MAVYVDQPLFPFGRMVMCHMWADSLDELHAMADRLGLKRAWFQCPPKASWEHYDVSKGVRAKALAFGAIETDRYGAVYFVAQREGRTEVVERIDRVRQQAAEDALAEQLSQVEASP
ncbi:DUF4031 domain-containing protein [Methylobacterium nodulans]|uniref:DUF4031 domain-containing protein n=1 Tax=Methylobacterium nodulans (strain LMG 21967 / CNCM I-2342 / ORS 2060) TaxID=460265 RepID=B8IGA5_METNO|nr:DUF4031 domain-containing protein [Methylobacterium nodulans]ACL61582.1 conserved hypothetical protein [Methylobacterium nodulans ORS 2060]